MKFISRQYVRAFSLLREARIFLATVTGLFVISGVIGYFLTIVFSEFFNEFMNTVRETLMESAIFDDEGNISAIMLFINNARAALVGIGQGFMPFVFAPVFSILLNGSLIGIVLGFQGNGGASVPLLFLTGIMPHGVFELPALIISWATGMLLCYSMIKLIFGKLDGDGFFELLKRTAAVYCCLVIPLLIIAAAVEANLTPRIMEAVLG